VKLLALALLLGASPAHADLRVALGNDLFTELDPPVDDDGFTHDFDLSFTRPYREHVVGGRLYQRWITEVPRSGGRRTDLFELVASFERSWWSGPLGPRGSGSVTSMTRAGPSLVGNLGGRWMQDGWHRLCGCGASVGQGLQSRYEGSTGIGALVGSRVRGSLGIPQVQTYGVVDAQAVLGAGVTFVDAAAGVQLTTRLGDVELSAHAEVALTRFHTNDERLGLRGGYGSGWQTAYRIGAHVAWSRYCVEYQYRANEGGSGEPIGVLAFTVKQAGARY
jgi:hypothetical protein